MQPFEITLNSIGLNYCLLDTTCFTHVEVNFPRDNSLRDRRVTAPNISTELNQCRESSVSLFTVGRRLCEADLYGEISVNKSILRTKNNDKCSSESRCTKNEQ